MNTEKTGFYYTILKNKTKTAKILLTHLNSKEIYPGQTVNLLEEFKLAEVMEATGEITFFIKKDFLEDLTPRDEQGNVSPEKQKQAEAQIAQKREEKKETLGNQLKETELLNISSSSSLSYLEDKLEDKDSQIQQAAALRIKQLMGEVDDNGVAIPGAGQPEDVEPSKFIPNPIKV